MKKILVILLVILLPFDCLMAQSETSNWYFGDRAGLKFDIDSVYAILGGQLQYNEGISNISDCKGRVLFYTDGIKVWNKNNLVMYNGSGLLGHYSATQGSIIVPHPGNCNLFFIFTLDGTENSFANGCRYSIVDMSRQNGLGGVTTKNILLYSPSSEKLTAVKHNNGTDIWVITHEMFSNSFYSYRVSNTGIDTVPIISSIGLPFSTVHDAIGQMKASPDGSKLAYVTLVNKITEIFDFDNSSGRISNPITIPDSKFTAIGGLYGLEFSPSSEKLYVTNPNINYLNLPGNLYQIDLLAGSATDIINSTILVGNNALHTDLRGLQLGPDKKIYASRSLGNYLGVINNPDLTGAGCNYVDSGISCGGQICGWTLPNFITSYFDTNYSTPLKANFEISQNCIGKDTYFTNLSTGNASEFAWDFGDGNISDFLSPTHSYQDTGEYIISLVINKDCCSDTVMRTVTFDDCEFDIFVPNSFSPNGDGVNDEFYISGVGIMSMSLLVINRWGESVFEADDLRRWWDGKYKGNTVPSGVYLYCLKVQFKNGDERKLNGHISVFK